jgi:streptogramin lyase
MEGVVVSAHRAGSTLTFSVPSDNNGRFRFPSSKLDPGQYTINIRAAGYELAAPQRVEIAAWRSAAINLKLVPTKDLSKQMSNAEWLASFPGSEDDKKDLLDCVSCHDLDLIVRSRHNAAEFVDVSKRMASYYPGSTPQHAQRLVGDAQRNLGEASRLRKVAEYLASINLSQAETWSYPLKTLPRLRGRSGRVIVTEYALPRALAQPHDVVLDADGVVWFNDFEALSLGRLNPKTGEVREFPIPLIKPGYPVGALDLEIDKAGDLWIGLMYQAGVARFDKKTETFQTWSIPKEWQTDAAQSGMVEPSSAHVDGKVWVKNSDGGQVMRLDPNTGQWENLGSFGEGGRRLAPYAIRADSANNLYLLDFRSSTIGVVNAKTKQFTAYRGAIDNARPRRGSVDSQNRLWYGEYGGNAIGMFDPSSGKIKEWVIPTPWSQPYDVVMDKHGEVWTGSMMSDRVSRLDPKTGSIVEYQLPQTTNIRRVFIDSSTTPREFWVGSNHNASIIKLEPLD